MNADILRHGGGEVVIALIVIEPVADVVPAVSVRPVLSPVPVMAALIAMLLSAFRVSVAGVAHVIGCDTVMLP